MLRVLWSQLQMLYIYLIKIVLASCHIKNYCFVITYLLKDEQELSLGMLIRCKCIYNFWCSLLVLHKFVYVLCALCGIIMYFLELTYWQDAAVPVPVFCCFWFQKSYTGNILEIGWNKKRSSYFHVTKTESEGESKRGSREATRGLGADSPGPTPRVRVGPPATADSASSPIYSPSRENPRHLIRNPRKVPTPPSTPKQDSGDRSLCSGALSGRGSAPGAISINSTAIFIAVADSHDEEGVVLPRGWGPYR